MKKTVFAVVGGALIGAATAGIVTYIFMDKKIKASIKTYDERVRILTERNGVKDNLVSGLKKRINVLENEDMNKEQPGPNINVIDNMIEASGYNQGVFNPEMPLVRSDEVEIIEFEQYGSQFSDYRGELTEYDILGWNYYIDGVFTDENGDVVEATKTLGQYVLQRFRNEYFHQGQELPDTLYLRHHVLKADIEIVPEFLSYKDDILPNQPREVKVEVPEDDVPPVEEADSIWEG